LGAGLLKRMLRRADPSADDFRLLAKPCEDAPTMSRTLESKPRRSGRRVAFPVLAGLAAAVTFVTLASDRVSRTGAPFTDAVSGSLSLESGRVDITPDAPVSIAFTGRIGPGATTSRTVTVANTSTVVVPAACVVLDVLTARSTTPNPFNEALGSVIDVTVERKPGEAASAAPYTTVASGPLTTLAGAALPAFGSGLETDTPTSATNQKGAVVDNGEAVTYRFTFSMAATVGNTVTYGGSPVTITGAYADATFQIAAQNVTAGTCAAAVSG
jgi:hypothetical protein